MKILWFVSLIGLFLVGCTALNSTINSQTNSINQNIDCTDAFNRQLTLNGLTSQVSEYSLTKNWSLFSPATFYTGKCYSGYKPGQNIDLIYCDNLEVQKHILVVNSYNVVLQNYYMQYTASVIARGPMPSVGYTNPNVDIVNASCSFIRLVSIQ